MLVQPEATSGYCADHPSETGSVVVWKGKMNFANGLAACKSEGMRLAVFRTEEQLNDIKAIVGDGMHNTYY